jgi:DNA-binding CsgD family transcriptional regulator
LNPAAAFFGKDHNESGFVFQDWVVAQMCHGCGAISRLDADCCTMICMSNHQHKQVMTELRMSNAQLEQLLDHVPLSIYVLNQDRALLYANLAGHEHLHKSRFVTLVCGRFQICGDSMQVSRFEKAVQAAAETLSNSAECRESMTLGEPKAAQASISVAPFVEQQSHDGLVLVMLTAQDECEANVTLRLQQTLGLTPAEARVAYFISTGRRPKMVADHLGISINTVKSHLAKIFSKTGCSDQAALCVLARQLPIPVRML